jgi:hypothetical protein
MKQKDIIAVFDNDQQLVSAIGRLKEKNIPIREAYTPFPVHDVLKMLGKESRLPFFSVFAGATTIVLVFIFLRYVAVIDYPLNFGGKPAFSLPSFVVIIYLLTILLTFITTVIAFQARTGLYPGKDPEDILPGSTDDKFIIALGNDEGLSDEVKGIANAILKESGAIEIVEKER